MTILALESSGFVASAALYQDGKILAEELLDGQLTHSLIAMPMLERVLLAANVALESVDAFAVNIGPGSFTGLRIGIGSANAMAFAMGKPVAAIDSLEALAANMPFFAGIVCPLIDARQDQIYGACFDLGSGAPKRLRPLFAGRIDDFLREAPADLPLLFLGDGATAQRAAIEAYFGGRAYFAPAHCNAHRAATLAVLGAMRLKAGKTVAEAQPLYLREPQAVRMREAREQAKANPS